MNYRHYFALEKQLRQAGYPINRFDAISQVTKGQKSGLSTLTSGEYTALVQYMRQMAAQVEDPAANRIRRKIIALFRKMGYESHGQAQMKRIYEWVQHYGQFHKPLNRHTVPELAKLASQVESMYQSFMKEVHR